MKNQLIQAFAAIAFADRKHRKLIFHMNGSRLEQFGANNLRNIQALFKTTPYQLVIHDWLPHAEFLELVAEMDICMQVSLSESFNIVSADAVSMGIPLVGSHAVRWLPKRSQAHPDSLDSILAVMANADVAAVHMNHEALDRYLTAAKATWCRWINN